MVSMSDMLTQTRTIRDRLVMARELAGLTQEQMADRLGASRKSIGRWERDDDPSPMVVYSYSGVTGVPVEWIANGGDLVLKSRCFSSSIDQLELFANGHSLVAA